MSHTRARPLPPRRFRQRLSHFSRGNCGRA
jgi:hypothetical protein